MWNSITKCRVLTSCLHVSALVFFTIVIVYEFLSLVLLGFPPSVFLQEVDQVDQVGHPAGSRSWLCWLSWVSHAASMSEHKTAGLRLVTLMQRRERAVLNPF